MVEKRRHATESHQRWRGPRSLPLAEQFGPRGAADLPNRTERRINPARRRADTSEALPRRLALVAVTVTVLLFDGFTWYLFTLGCEIAENTDPTTMVCTYNDPSPLVLAPLVGIPIALITALLGRPLANQRAFWAGTGVAAMCGAALWAIAITGL